MEKCLLTGMVLVRKLNLQSTRQIMVVIIIDYLFHIQISVKMCSVQIRNAVLCFIWRNERSRKLRFVNFWISFRGTFHRECMAFLQT